MRAVKESVIRANFELGQDVLDGFNQGLEKEESPVGKEILERLIENARIAREARIPICQDTGLAVIFAELGQGVNITGGDFNKAIEAGVRQGYGEGYLRKSVCLPGDALKLWVVPKGGGSENMSRLFMLPPSAGWPGIKERVIQTVVEAGPNPCPPTIVGVGIGGNFERCALLAKKALLRPLGSPNPDHSLHQMEEELLLEINKTGVGPQGLGGRVTSLGVHLLMMACHIASLPLAVNIQCHASRHLEITL
jgi:fumarate hydratase subunit alpha